MKLRPTILLIALLVSCCHSLLGVVIGWDEVPNVTGYNVYYGPSSRNYTAFEFVDSRTNVARITNLTAGVTYYFSVTAVRGQEESDYSKEVTFTPAPLFDITTTLYGSSDFIVWSPLVRQTNIISSSLTNLFYKSSTSILPHP